jgi:hypothetical protein
MLSMMLGWKLKLSKFTVLFVVSVFPGIFGDSCFKGIWVTIVFSLFLCWRPSWFITGFWTERAGAWKPLCGAGGLCGAGALGGAEAFRGGEALYGQAAFGGVSFSGITGDAPAGDAADVGSVELPFK